MQYLLQLFLILLGLVRWTTSQVIPPLVILPNVSYGADPQQKMDILLPGGRDATVTKVIVLIHGGGWTGGQKEHMLGYAHWFYVAFPRHAIVNMGYRLATPDSPSYPKQLVDIGLVLQHITAKQSYYKVLPQFALVGVSAGGHLSMLYGYAFDKSLQVNVICNVVGPTDFTDPAYPKNPVFAAAMENLVGKDNANKPGMLAAVSPVHHITRQSPKTISFFGALDDLIPVSQGTRLEDRLDAAGVVNKYYMYPNEGHLFSNATNIAHALKKIYWFFKTHF